MAVTSILVPSTIITLSTFPNAQIYGRTFSLYLPIFWKNCNNNLGGGWGKRGGGSFEIKLDRLEKFWEISNSHTDLHIFTLIPYILLHLHTCFPHFLTLPPWIPGFPPWIPAFPPHPLHFSPHSHLDFPHSQPLYPCSHDSHSFHKPARYSTAVILLYSTFL